MQVVPFYSKSHKYFADILILGDVLVLGDVLILGEVLILGGTQADWGQIDGSCCIVSTSNPAGVLYLLIPGYQLKGS